MKLFILFLFSVQCQAAVDPSYGAVTFLSQWAGADAATTAVESRNGIVLTFNGNAQIDTAQFPVGMSSSLLLDGTGDFISAPANAAYALGSGDFTIEGWWYWNAISGTKKNLVSSYGTSSNHGWAIVASNSAVRIVIPDDSPIDSSTTITTGQWYHVALSKYGSLANVFQDGVSIGTFVDTKNWNGNNYTLQIGRTQTITDDFNGWVGPIRITKGIARYTANFTRPSLPYPTTANGTRSLYLEKILHLEIGFLAPLPILFLPRNTHAITQNQVAESSGNKLLWNNYVKKIIALKVTPIPLATATPDLSTQTATPTPTPKATDTPVVK